MNSVVATLPGGRRGQALACGMTIVAVAVLWVGLISPVLGWYDQRQDRLEQRQLLAARMQAVAETEPALRQHMATGTADDRAIMIEGVTEAVAGAALQQRLQDMAEHAAMRMSSAEILAVQPSGGDRLLRVHLALSGSWTRLVTMLADIDRASPRMLVSEMQIGRSRSVTTDPVKLLDVSLTVEAFYASRDAVK